MQSQDFSLVTLIFLLSFGEKQMQHIAVKSNLVETTAETKLVFGGNNAPLCPKPRRPASALPEFLNPLGCNNHSQVHSGGRSGILNMITEKAMDERESICTGCSSSCYCGSPPGRTDNPLVHDVQFIHQMERYSQYTRKKLPDKFGFTSASPA